MFKTRIILSKKRPSFLQLDNFHPHKEASFKNHDISVEGAENPDLLHSKVYTLNVTQLTI
jgi:hypothetical protein